MNKVHTRIAALLAVLSAGIASAQYTLPTEVTTAIGTAEDFGEALTGELVPVVGGLALGALAIWAVIKIARYIPKVFGR